MIDSLFFLFMLQAAARAGLLFSFSMKSSIFFGQSSCFHMWSRRVQQEGCLAAELCGRKLNRSKNRTVCVCVCQADTHELKSSHSHTVEIRTGAITEVFIGT